MAAERRWFDRRFQLGLGVEAAPGLLERLRETPARLANVVEGLSTAQLTRRAGNNWSIQENVGHLLDLESLWDVRLDDFDSGATVLHAADLENRKTHEAAHNDRAIAELLSEFRRARFAVLARLDRMNAAELGRTALHPRLQQPMSVVDLCFFVAEHDDHHIRTMEELK